MFQSASIIIISLKLTKILGEKLGRYSFLQSLDEEIETQMG